MANQPTGGSTCTTCGLSFVGHRDFDSHRVGRHDALFTPETPWGRRCLGVDELRNAGWYQDRFRRWGHGRRKKSKPPTAGNVAIADTAAAVAPVAGAQPANNSRWPSRDRAGPPSDRRRRRRRTARPRSFFARPAKPSPMAHDRP